MKYWVLIVVLAFVLAACGGGDESASSANTPANESANQNIETTQSTTDSTSDTDDTSGQNNPDTVVAVVNDEPIPRDAFERELARRKQFTQAVNEESLRNAVIATLIEQELIRQAARGFSITVTDADVQAEIDALITQAGSQDVWLNWLEQNLYTEAEIFEATRLQLITQQVREQVINMGQSPDETVMKVHARHILVSSDTQAQEILTRLQNGEDFATLAAQYSRDITTKDAGGDLGFFVREDLTTPELADAAFSLQPGQIAGPIATALGYHVIQTLEFEEQPVTEITQGLQAEARFSTWLETQRRAARIEILNG